MSDPGKDKLDLDETAPHDPLAMTNEDREKIREIQTRALREVGSGLDSMVRIRMPGQNKKISREYEEYNPDHRRPAKVTSWVLFALLIGLVFWAVQVLVVG